MKTKRASGGLLMFWCPGCVEAHNVRAEGPHAWTVSGAEETLTIRPSILVTGNGPPRQCHSFVTDGSIQFLGDCTHALAGITVPIPDWPYHE